MCPHFRKARGNHPDAQPGRALKGLGSNSGPPLFLQRGRVFPQPPDGSCLFHSVRTLTLSPDSNSRRSRNLKVSSEPMARGSSPREMVGRWSN